MPITSLTQEVEIRIIIVPDKLRKEVSETPISISKTGYGGTSLSSQLQ
jgi:hypothetical protein